MSSFSNKLTEFKKIFIFFKSSSSRDFKTLPQFKIFFEKIMLLKRLKNFLTQRLCSLED